MHDEAAEYVARQVLGRDLKPKTVLDVGGMMVNGHVRWVAPEADWTSLDITPGPSVDVVADAATWEPAEEYDLVLCLEVFEHAPRWPLIVETLAKATKQGGTCVVTCATDPRPAHGAHGAEVPVPGEHYENVDPIELQRAMWRVFREVVDFEVLPRGDLQVMALR